MKDIPLVNGSRLKLVLGMKGGPISSKRVVTISDYENWFDMSDVLSRSVPYILCRESSDVMLSSMYVYTTGHINYERYFRFSFVLISNALCDGN